MEKMNGGDFVVFDIGMFWKTKYNEVLGFFPHLWAVVGVNLLLVFK